MRERSILFARDMVLALRSGWKTQTRRLVTPQPDRSHRLDGGPMRIALGTRELRFPFGDPGDRLCVREKWGYLRQFLEPGAEPGGPLVYAADGNPPCARATPWKPSLHMPRSACRMVLEVTAGRVERLQELTPADARAEGCPPAFHADPVKWFAEYWSRFNAERGFGWDVNPWVWVVSFKVLGEVGNAAVEQGAAAGENRGLFD
jgi:hypothetical protein